jgi:hypothetical protein
MKTGHEVSLAYVLYICLIFDFVPVACVFKVKPSKLTQAIMLLTFARISERDAKYSDFSAISFSHYGIF